MKHEIPMRIFNKAYIGKLWPGMPYLIAIFLVFYCSNIYWGGTRYKTFFLSDACGYYAYAPATFIYQDYRFNFINEMRNKHYRNAYGFDLQYQNEIVDKYFCGTAIAITPFFLLSHAIAHLTHKAADGYSFWYAWGMNIAAIFYCLAGLLALQKILKRFFRSDGQIAFVLFLIVFATNLQYYTTTEPLMSHVYSFAFVNLFLLTVIRWMDTHNAKYIPAMSFFLGMIILLRPVNGIIVFIFPFLAGSVNKLKESVLSLFNKKSTLVISLIIFSFLIFVQLLCYYLQSGKWFVYAYGGEKMDLSNPHLILFLFSYKKGLFVWIPLSFIALAGFIFLFRQNRFRFFSLLAFLLFTWYVLSSWWNWWYGGSFGTRPMVEFYFAIAFLLGNALENFRSWGKRIFVTLCLMCFVLCQVQTYQYRYTYIHWSDMDKKSYWKVFMRVDLILKKQNPNEDLIY